MSPDDAIPFVVGFVYSVVISIVFFAFSVMDITVVHSCKQQGYWQTGQTRVICSVEEPKKGE